MLTIYYILFMMYIIFKALQECQRKLAETYRIYAHLNVCKSVPKHTAFFFIQMKNY